MQPLHVCLQWPLPTCCLLPPMGAKECIVYSVMKCILKASQTLCVTESIVQRAPSVSDEILITLLIGIVKLLCDMVWAESPSIDPPPTHTLICT